MAKKTITRKKCSLTILYVAMHCNSIPVAMQCITIGFNNGLYSLLQKYNNESDCSSLCQCMRNDSLRCEKLPCKLDLSCRVNQDVVYSKYAYICESRCIQQVYV